MVIQSNSYDKIYRYIQKVRATSNSVDWVYHELKEEILPYPSGWELKYREKFNDINQDLSNIYAKLSNVEGKLYKAADNSQINADNSQINFDEIDKLRKEANMLIKEAVEIMHELKFENDVRNCPAYLIDVKEEYMNNPNSTRKDIQIFAKFMKRKFENNDDQYDDIICQYDDTTLNMTP